jgi:hypothetical protein
VSLLQKNRRSLLDFLDIKEHLSNWEIKAFVYVFIIIQLKLKRHKREVVSLQKGARENILTLF